VTVSSDGCPHTGTAISPNTTMASQAMLRMARK
jgi:hypothetical protein